ncbi:hypothetical protein KX729_30195 [Rhizobium sp. XQZ8]|uniref:I78 family peptidase inhibitor n=1 Tax=Rhizobium populisoli TaxID=2859785 RepID=UPI001CA587E4|nr:I78 family peptidase inhibitor [Rhizobium populisoli]MBW6425667.1 hypothetical protein [Rhizobium populisoli]
MNPLLRIAPVVASLCVISGLIACSTVSDVSRGRCDTAAALALVGQPKLTDRAAMDRTRATVVRQIAPGQPVTHDYRNNRVTLETDPASGRLVRATCG